MPLLFTPTALCATSFVLHLNEVGCILKKECVSASTHCMRQPERRRDETGSRHLSVREGGWTIQISPSPRRQQTQRALWGEDKHAIDFRFENGKCTVYNLTLGEWGCEHSPAGEYGSYFFHLKVYCTDIQFVMYLSY